MNFIFVLETIPYIAYPSDNDSKPRNASGGEEGVCRHPKATAETEKEISALYYSSKVYCRLFNI